jgi:inosine-uridine nucleoside N-ribohydrolase
MAAASRASESTDVATVRRWKFGTHPWLDRPPSLEGRPRVIVDNDFSGDPDDLYQLVHHALSPAAEIRLVIGSHLRPGDPLDNGPDTAHNAYLVAEDLLNRMGADHEDLVVRGAQSALADTSTPHDTEAARRIIAEAMSDEDTPLFYAAGGGLTDLASAYLLEPRIAGRLILIWIGGGEHLDLAAPPPDAMPIEYNLLIDVNAGRVVFDSGIEIWQVPRNVYRQCLVSDAELRRRVRDTGPLGRYLYDETRMAMDRVGESGTPTDTYVLGDSPLVLLTSLRTTFEPDAASSEFVVRPTPSLTKAGAYQSVEGRKAMRVFTRVDTRLMFEDFFLKLEDFARWQADEWEGPM